MNPPVPGDIVGFRELGCAARCLAKVPSFNFNDTGHLISETDTAFVVDVGLRVGLRDGSYPSWLHVLTRHGMGYLWSEWVKRL